MQSLVEMVDVALKEIDRLEKMEARKRAARNTEERFKALKKKR